MQHTPNGPTFGPIAFDKVPTYGPLFEPSAFDRPPTLIKTGEKISDFVKEKPFSVKAYNCGSKLIDMAVDTAPTIILPFLLLAAAAICMIGANLASFFEDTPSQLQSWMNQFTVGWMQGGQLFARVNWNNAGGNPPNMQTCSESIAYAMRLLADNPDATFNLSVGGQPTKVTSQALFDALYAYASSQFDTNGLMNWEINGDGKVIGDGSATDADCDMAYALIRASQKWGVGRFNYNTEARTMLNNIRQFDCFIGTGGQGTNYPWTGAMLSPGDGWGAAGQQNFDPSYVDPYTFSVFESFQQDGFWQQLTTNCLTVIAGVSAKNATGLMPDWYNPSDFGTAPNYASNYYYGYDACRTPWRLAEYLKNVSKTDTTAQQIIPILTNLMNFFMANASQQGSLCSDGYTLDGKPRSSSSNSPAFDGPAAAALQVLLDKGLYPPEGSPYTNAQCHNFAASLEGNVTTYLSNIPSPYGQIGSTPYYNSVLGLLTEDEFSQRTDKIQPPAYTPPGSMWVAMNPEFAPRPPAFNPNVDWTKLIKRGNGPKDSCYIDMGILYGNYIIGNCMDWWPLPVKIDQPKVDAFLASFFQQLTKDGTERVELSFAQICDINALLNGTKGSPNDTITPIFTDGYCVGNTPDNFLKYFVEKAKANGIKVDLSFGGANASSTDMKFNDDPATQAKNLANFMNTYGIDSVDFDIEGTGLAIMTENDPEAVITFFSTLHTQLAASNKTAILTVAGAIQNGPTGILAPLFTNFSQMFDGVNLMLYSNTQYYLDADNVTWGISQWLKYVPDPSTLHIGFYDKIAYEDPASSAGEQYQIPAGYSRGKAAAWIYMQLLQNLGISPNQMGEPFWWTDDPTTISTNQVLQDFNEAFNAMKQIPIAI